MFLIPQLGPNKAKQLEHFEFSNRKMRSKAQHTLSAMLHYVLLAVRFLFSIGRAITAFSGGNCSRDCNTRSCTYERNKQFTFEYMNWNSLATLTADIPHSSLLPPSSTT